MADNNQLQRFKSSLDPKKRRRNSSSHNIKETYKIIKGHDEQGLSMVNEYSFEKKLGEGAFGKVKLAKKKDSDEKFAIKILKKSLLKRKREFIKEGDEMKIKDALEDALREIAIMKKLDHPNVIKLYEVIEDPEDDKLYLILDYAEGGQLMEWSTEENIFYLRTTLENDSIYLIEDYLRQLFRDIVKGLHYLHNNGIIHRDIKPQNILFDHNKVAKIGDFGVSLIVEEQGDILNKCAGTYHFMSPESIKTKDKQNKGFSGKRADIWALGVTLFAFTYKIVPFDGDNVIEILENIENQDLILPDIREISEEMQDLLKGLLNKNPEKHHVWVNQNSKTLLREEINTFQVQISEKDIQNALLPLHTIVLIKTMVSRWRKRSLSRSQSPQSEGNSPLLISGGRDFKPLKPSNLSKTPFSQFNSTLQLNTIILNESFDRKSKKSSKHSGSPPIKLKDDGSSRKSSRDIKYEEEFLNYNINSNTPSIFVKHSPKTSPKISNKNSPTKSRKSLEYLDEMVEKKFILEKVPEINRSNFENELDNEILFFKKEEFKS